MSYDSPRFLDKIWVKWFVFSSRSAYVTDRLQVGFFIGILIS